MKQYSFIMKIALLVLSQLWVENLSAKNSDENKITTTSATIDFDFVSRYLWRCIISSDGPAWQPSASVSKWGLTPSLWASMPLSQESSRAHFNEVDLGLSYEHQIANLTFKPNFVYFFYPNTTDPSTGELSLEATYTFRTITLGLSHSFDVSEYPGAYFANFFIGYSRDIGESFSFNGTLSTGWASSEWNNAYFGVGQTALNHVALDLSLECRLWAWLYVRPHMQFGVLTSPSLRGAVADPNPIVLGISLGGDFSP